MHQWAANRPAIPAANMPPMGAAIAKATHHDQAQTAAERRKLALMRRADTHQDIQ